MSLRKSILFPCVGVPCFFGCHSLSTSDIYPEGWPPQGMINVNTCPDISGQYENMGEMTGGLATLCKTPIANPKLNEWNCDVFLATNLVLGIGDRSAMSVNLQNSDPNTLNIATETYLSEDFPTRRATYKLSRNYDYRCDSLGLTLSRTGSTFSLENSDQLNNATITIFGLVFGFAGISSVSRSFRRLEDGSLVMEVTSDRTAVADFLAGVKYGFHGFVRWKPFIAGVVRTPNDFDRTNADRYIDKTDVINCVVDGERLWVPRFKCD